MKRATLLRIFLSTLILFPVATYLAYGQEEPKVEWVARYNGPKNSSDCARAIAVDLLGNVYVTGYSYGDGSSSDYATVKYDWDGNELWVARYNGPGNSWDYGQAIALDRLGNVYVTGRSYGSGTGYDYATVKYDNDGNELWAARYTASEHSSDHAYALAVDAQGNVYVTGDSSGSGTSSDYATIKYDRDGIELWVARYNGPGSSSDFAWDIAVDPRGNVYVTGYSYYGIETYFDYATVKYDRDGNEVWAAGYDGPGNSSDHAYALAVDAQGNVYVTGGSYGSETGSDYATVKYDRDGNEVWAARYNDPVNDFDEAEAIAVDRSGNVYVTGYSYYGIETDFDYATVKYDRDGNEVWVARYNGPGNYYDYASAIAVDPLGNVCVTGESYGSGIGTDYATVRYDRDGNEVWAARYNGPGDDYDYASAIAVDPLGNVYVTGWSYEGLTQRHDYATVKYSNSLKNR